MIAYLLDKIASFRLARLRGAGPAPKAADSPASATPQLPCELKGIPSDAFFFDSRQAHPDGSSCGAGCGSSNSCGNAYPGGNT